MNDQSRIARSPEIAAQLERARRSADRLVQQSRALRDTTRRSAATPATLLLAGLAGFALASRRGRSAAAGRTPHRPLTQGLKGVTQVLVTDGLIHLANRYIEHARRRRSDRASALPADLTPERRRPE